jgi:hypothetical protein
MRVKKDKVYHRVIGGTLYETAHRRGYRMWLLSPRILPVSMLVMIPISTSILSIVFSYFIPFFIAWSFFGPARLVTAYSYLYIASAITILYALYPIKLCYIKKRGFTELLTEYGYIKKVLYFEIPILIVTTFFFRCPFISTWSS